jgi:hypothetical protein
MDNLQFVSYSNHPAFWIDSNNQAYVLNRTVDETRYLKCKLSYLRKCPATARIIGDQFIHTKEHTCVVDQTTWEIEIATAKMKTAAGTTTAPLKDIYNLVMSESSTFVKSNLTWPKCEQILRYQRSKNIPQIPRTILEMIDQLSAGEHPFGNLYRGHVQYEDSEGTTQRAIIFADLAILAKVSGKFSHFFTTVRKIIAKGV